MLGPWHTQPRHTPPCDRLRGVGRRGISPMLGELTAMLWTSKTRARSCRNDLRNFSAFLRAEWAEPSPSRDKAQSRETAQSASPATRNETQSAPGTALVQWFGAAEGCEATHCPSEHSPPPLAKAEPDTSQGQGRRGEQPGQHGSPARGLLAANRPAPAPSQSAQSTTQKSALPGPAGQCAGPEGSQLAAANPHHSPGTAQASYQLHTPAAGLQLPLHQLVHVSLHLFHPPLVVPGVLLLPRLRLSRLLQLLTHLYDAVSQAQHQYLGRR